MVKDSFFIEAGDTGGSQESFFVKPEEASFSAKRAAQNAGAIGGSQLLSTPHTMLSFLQFLKNKGMLGAWGNALPDEPLEAGQRATSSFEDEFKKFQDFYGIEPPQTKGEKRTANFGGAALGGLLTGGPEGALISGAGQAAGEAADAFGAPESVQNAINFGTSLATAGRKAITKPLTSTALERSIANDAEKVKLYELGKKYGMTDEQLTPILQNENRLGNLGKIGKRTPKIYESVEEGRRGAGKIYESLKEKGYNRPAIDELKKQRLAEDLEKVRDKLSRIKEPSDERAAAIKRLDGLIKKVYAEPLHIDELINQNIDLNNIEWKKFGGKPYFEETKDAIQKTISSEDAEMGKDFRTLNGLYSRASKAEEILGKPGGLERGLNALFFGSEVAALATGLATSNVSLIASTVGAYAARKIAAKLVTDPKWQALHKTLVKALEQNKAGLAVSALNGMRKQAKKDKIEDEDDEEIDWPEA